MLFFVAGTQQEEQTVLAKDMKFKLLSGDYMPMVGSKYLLITFCFLIYLEFLKWYNNEKWGSFLHTSDYECKHNLIFLVGTYQIKGQELINQTLDYALEAGYRLIGKQTIFSKRFYSEQKILICLTIK